MGVQHEPCYRQPWRTAAAALVFSAICSLVIWRLYELQVVHASDLAQRALRQRTRSLILEPQRGSIIDRNGQPLAVSVAGWDVYADPGYMTDKLRATVELAALSGLPRAELRQQFEARSNGRRVIRNINDDQAEAVRALALDGVYLRRSHRRDYPLEELAAHVLGFVLAEGQGGGGLEMRYEEHLRGRPGSERVRVDVRGRHLVDLDAYSIPAQAGGNVHLTLDAAIQAETEAALAAAVERHRPESASAIVLRPGSGEVVAMASWPSFDPRHIEQVDPESLRNNNLAFVYESGSIMKPLVTGAAVADGLVQWNTRIFCENGQWVARVGRHSRTVTDHSFARGGNAWLTVTEGLARSDNVMSAKVALRMEPGRLYDWMRNFGFGQATGIELAGENRGMMRPRSRWDRLNSVISVSIGHEMSVTPLQMAAAHAAVANRGIWNTPHVVSHLTRMDPETGVLQELPSGFPREQRRLLSSEDALAIQQAMVSVMTEGTGRRIRLDGWTSAGKTGTTRKLINGVYSTSHHIGSFVSWAPARRDIQPAFLVLVTIDNPTREGYFGGQTAGPVVKRILEFALAHEQVPTDAELDAQTLAGVRP